MKLWTCLVTMPGHTTVTQLRAPSPENAVSEFVKAKVIERILGQPQTPWSENAPHRRVLGPEMNQEFVGSWDLTITGGDNQAISLQLIETVDQEWELPDDEF